MYTFSFIHSYKRTGGVTNTVYKSATGRFIVGLLWMTYTLDQMKSGHEKSSATTAIRRQQCLLCAVEGHSSTFPICKTRHNITEAWQTSLVRLFAWWLLGFPPPPLPPLHPLPPAPDPLVTHPSPPTVRRNIVCSLFSYGAAESSYIRRCFVLNAFK